MASDMADLDISCLSVENGSAIEESKDQVVTPWKVEGRVVDGRVEGIDYGRLIDRFGTKYLDEALLQRFEALIGQKLHVFLRRGIVFSHRDFSNILDQYERGEPFYIYTGRGPSSSSMHLGHMVPFLWLQDVFDVPVVIQLTDDEKYLFKQELKLEDTRQFARENARDIIACGFNPEKTLIFIDTEFVSGSFYQNIVRVSKDSVGKYHFVCVQAAPSFSNSFPSIFGGRTDIPCLIPMAIDQDPYFRLTRDVADRIGYLKPSLIHTRFFPALQGHGTKMSASDENTAIYMCDTPSQIKNKINKHAFSGGGATLEEHRLRGGNTEIDVSFTYLKYFLEDDNELERIRNGYSSGKIPTGELKAITIAVLQQFVAEFQERLRLVTDDTLSLFLDPNKKIKYT
ncbi:hypothetical protein MERGE_001428 [Pneumocystis wakefieldiae]|uniref:Tryptophan--tRNA ligase, cytoplasmic n=1 Tax=Pneumocystis wakefieldiae TaxID=38082 RepID=A0A899FYZ8_9ASCO|nr:hypothetical protein MERGE_001428 [Pneumocystis wakefieldiae]